MTHLFLFTIGPVQSFIAQARKTRDLYAGSRLLSELVLTGMDVFVKYGGEVIFPKSRSTSQPNRFLGRIDEDKLKEKELNGAKLTLRKLGKHIEKEVESQWQNVAKNSVAVLGTPDGFDEQIKNALETFWAFHPIDKNNYREAYRGIERTLGAIKNARPASQYHYQKENGQLIYGERGRKCSLDGERNVKFYRLQKETALMAACPQGSSWLMLMK